MQRSFKARLEALEALEAEREQEGIRSGVSGVGALADDALLAAVFDGLRSYNLYPCFWWLNGESEYWKAIATRASDLYEARGVWVCPVTPAEAQIAIDALVSSRWLLHVRSTSHGWSGTWYDPTPPPPYPGGCWATPEYHALKRLAHALRIWSEMWREVQDAPPLPRTTEDVIQWLTENALGRELCQ